MLGVGWSATRSPSSHRSIKCGRLALRRAVLGKDMDGDFEVQPAAPAPTLRRQVVDARSAASQLQSQLDARSRSDEVKAKARRAVVALSSSRASPLSLPPPSPPPSPAASSSVLDLHLLGGVLLIRLHRYHPWKRVLLLPGNSPGGT